jgi:hypothetical protein
MRRPLTAVVLLGGILSSGALAQGAPPPPPPFRIGTHIAGNMTHGAYDFVRVGGQLVIALDKRLSGYPTVSRFLDGGEWEVTAALRYRPFGPADGGSPFYFGVGWAAVEFGPNARGYDLWLTGLEVPTGRLRPYVEFQFLGLINRAVDTTGDYGLQLYSGLTWVVK